MSLYFAYGSNLWLNQMKERCPEHSLIGNGVLRGYKWIISSRGYANIVSSPGSSVLGLVYSVSQSDEDTLDHKEGVIGGSYRKEWLNIDIGECCESCLVYIDSVEEEGRPRPEYILRINAGVKDAKLPEDYVREVIRRFVPEDH